MIKKIDSKIVLKFLYGQAIFMIFALTIGFARFSGASIPDLEYHPNPLLIVQKHKAQQILPPLFPRKSYFTDFGDESSFNDSLRGMQNITNYEIAPSTRLGIFFKNKVRIGVNVQF